ncbi:EcsC family protein [Bacillus sp. NPDC077027]|uniref:EcsC family protein n=1 Tax=Bacillus sp. NPDC077027 TaxID=3390548 RepID=UPI003D03BCD0
MDEAERLLYEEAVLFQTKFLRKASKMERFSKGVQQQVNSRIPARFHQVITNSVKAMVEATVSGTHLTSFTVYDEHLSIPERNELAKEKINYYQKTAAVEGIGTGAGGVLLGIADFPLLLSIKMKCLYELASIYGFDLSKKDERLFLLCIFQLAFSSNSHRRDILKVIEEWDTSRHEIDWHNFQQEYRDYIDLVKLFQLMPVLGAAIGGVANHQLTGQLGDVARYVFHLRLLKGKAAHE